MELHFYTTHDNIQKLNEGDTIEVWTRYYSKNTDIHVSLSRKKYAFHKLDNHIYEVSVV